MRNVFHVETSCHEASEIDIRWRHKSVCEFVWRHSIEPNQVEKNVDCMLAQGTRRSGELWSSTLNGNLLHDISPKMTKIKSNMCSILMFGEFDFSFTFSFC